MLFNSRFIIVNCATNTFDFLKIRCYTLQIVHTIHVSDWNSIHLRSSPIFPYFLLSSSTKLSIQAEFIISICFWRDDGHHEHAARCVPDKQLAGTLLRKDQVTAFDTCTTIQHPQKVYLAKSLRSRWMLSIVRGKAYLHTKNVGMHGLGLHTHTARIKCM